MIVGVSCRFKKLVMEGEGVEDPVRFDSDGSSKTKVFSRGPCMRVGMMLKRGSTDGDSLIVSDEENIDFVCSSIK